MIVLYITPYHTPPLPLPLINHTPKNVAYPKFRHVTTSEAGKACRDKFRALSYIVTLYFFYVESRAFIDKPEIGNYCVVFNNKNNRFVIKWGLVDIITQKMDH